MAPIAPTPTVELLEDHLRIDIARPGSLLALRGQITVPYSCILMASATRGAFPGWLVMRIGTHVPTKFAAGTFWRDGAKRFLYFRRGERVLRLDLERHEFESVEVAVADPERVAADVRERVGGK